MQLTASPEYVIAFLTQLETLSPLPRDIAFKLEVSEKKGNMIKPAKAHRGDQFCVQLFGLTAYGYCEETAITQWMTLAKSRTAEYALMIGQHSVPPKNHDEEIARVIAQVELAARL